MITGPGRGGGRGRGINRGGGAVIIIHRSVAGGGGGAREPRLRAGRYPADKSVEGDILSPEQLRGGGRRPNHDQPFGTNTNSIRAIAN